MTNPGIEKFVHKQNDKQDFITERKKEKKKIFFFEVRFFGTAYIWWPDLFLSFRPSAHLQGRPLKNWMTVRSQPARIE